jgi:hypothetical protein
MEVSDQFHAPAALPAGRPRYPLDRRLSGPKSLSGRSGDEEKNSQPLPGLELPIIQPVSHCYATEISWLRR